MLPLHHVKLMMCLTLQQVLTHKSEKCQGDLPLGLWLGEGLSLEWWTGSMEVQVSEPVVRVPVLSKAMVVHLTRASSTLPPCIRMPLQHSSPEGSGLGPWLCRSVHSDTGLL